MWAVSTFIILYAMLCCVPQFCVTEDRNGKSITFVIFLDISTLFQCMKRPILSYFMSPVLIILIFMGIGVFLWQWMTCQADYELFHDLFKKCHKDERFLSELEFRLNCFVDDVQLNSTTWVMSRMISPNLQTCDGTIDRSILGSRWLNPLFYINVIWHVVMFLGFGFANKGKDCLLLFSKTRLLECLRIFDCDNDSCKEDDSSQTFI